MMMHEWTERTTHEPTPEEWEVIHTVYNFSASILDVGGKDQLARLFSVGGMALLRDMLPNAKRREEIERRLCALAVWEEKENLRHARRLDQLKAERAEEDRLHNMDRAEIGTKRADLLKELTGFCF